MPLLEKSVSSPNGKISFPKTKPCLTSKSRLLLDEDKFRGVVSSFAGDVEDVVEGMLWQLGCARENPQIVGAATADERPLIIFVEGENVVVRVEEPEER